MPRLMINTVLSTAVFMALCRSPAAGDNLFDTFKNPSAEARPFVRWWWGENAVVEKEILREIDISHAVKPGANGLVIKVTTVLHDHTRTLDKATCAGFWTRPTRRAVPAGLIGPVQLFAGDH